MGDTLISINNLAEVLQSRGYLAEAEPLCRQALEGFRQTLGGCHPSTLTSIRNLARLSKEQKRFAEAETLCRQALEGRRTALGDNHPDTLASITDLAQLIDAKSDDLGNSDRCCEIAMFKCDLGMDCNECHQAADARPMQPHDPHGDEPGNSERCCGIAMLKCDHGMNCSDCHQAAYTQPMQSHDPHGDELCKVGRGQPCLSPDQCLTRMPHVLVPNEACNHASVIGCSDGCVEPPRAPVSDEDDEVGFLRWEAAAESKNTCCTRLHQCLRSFGNVILRTRA